MDYILTTVKPVFKGNLSFMDTFSQNTKVSLEDRFFCIEVSLEDRFYCIEVSFEDRFYCIEVSCEDRFHCIEMSLEKGVKPGFTVLRCPLKTGLLHRGVP